MLNARVLVLEAGSASSSNFIRSLRAGAPRVVIVGCNQSRFVLKKSLADRSYLLPMASDRSGAALRGIIRAEGVDLVIPTTDS